MAFDALSLSVLVNELQICLKDAKINKITQPEKDEIVLYVYNGNSYRLVLSAAATLNRIHLTDETFANPSVAPNFCMLLRKHLTSATISSITQLPYERAVDFALCAKNDLGYDENKHLLFELTGKTANLILTDGNYVIFDTLKHLPVELDSTRIMLAGMKYEFFAERNRIKPNDFDKIQYLVESSALPIKQLLVDNILGVSVQTVNEIMFGIDENNHSSLNAQRIVDSIRSYLLNLQHPNPNITMNNGVPIEVYPFLYRSVKVDRQYYDSFNKAHDEFFLLKDKALRFAQKSKSVTTVIKNTINRTEKKLAIYRNSLYDCSNAEQMRICGELILANIYRIKRNDSVLSADNYYDDNKTVDISLDSTKSPQQNANEYFKKYRKQKSTIEYTLRLQEENEKLLEYLHNIAQDIKFCETDSDLQEINNELIEKGIIKKPREVPKKLPESKPVEYEIEGFAVLVGKNNTQNDNLTNRIAKTDDLWLHTQAIHSSHVIVQSNGRPIPDSVILTAAEITAFYSQARESGKIPVDYTLKKNLNKPKKGDAGFVTYNVYNTLIVFPNPHIDLLKKHR